MQGDLYQPDRKSAKLEALLGGAGRRTSVRLGLLTSRDFETKNDPRPQTFPNMFSFCAAVTFTGRSGNLPILPEASLTMSGLKVNTRMTLCVRT